MRKLHIDWENLNWLKQDVTLAEEEGCTKELVRRKRIEYGKPQSPDYRLNRRRIALERRVAHQADRLRNKTIAEIGRMVKAKPYRGGPLWKILKMQGIPLKRKKYERMARAQVPRTN